MNDLESNKKETIIRARTCMLCKEYVEINPRDPNNQKLIYLFEKKHISHNFLITRAIREINEVYTCIKKVD